MSGQKEYTLTPSLFTVSPYVLLVIGVVHCGTKLSFGRNLDEFIFEQISCPAMPTLALPKVDFNYL